MQHCVGRHADDRPAYRERGRRCGLWSDEIPDHMNVTRMIRSAIPLRRCRCQVMIGGVGMLNVTRTRVMLAVSVRRRFAHAAVRKHENTG